MSEQEYHKMHQHIMRDMLDEGGYVLNPGNALPPGYAYGPMQVEITDGDDPIKNLIKVTCYREIYKIDDPCTPS